jgi:hypothetical protein
MKKILFKFSLACIALAVLCGVAQAQLVNLLGNPGFEMPDIGKYTNFDNGPTPYWNDDGVTYVNTGVENAGAHSGTYRAFEMAGDDGAYQISPTTVPLHLGDQVILTWWAVGTTSSDAQGTNATDPMQIVGIITSTNSQGTPPYVNDPFTDTTAVLITSNGIPSGWTQYALTYTARASDVGKYPGVFFNTGEVGGTITPNCFAAYDDFCLSYVLVPPPPVITCPSNITVTTTNPSGAVVNYTVTVSGGCPPITTNCVPPSGSVFPIGTNTVICCATDFCGQSNCCSFTVTVSPPPPLSITCPGNITVTTPNPTGVVVNYTVTVSGGCPPYTTNCVPPSGSVFPIGTNTVNCCVRDSCGQSNCCSFTVTVTFGSPPAVAQLLAGTSGSGEGKVYAYQGGTNWTAISPSLGYAVLDIIQFNGTLYAATESINYVGEVWRYDSGTSWTVVGTDMDSEVCALEIYNGQLYAGTAWNGGKLYRYNAFSNRFDYVGSVPGFSGIGAMYSSSYNYLQLGHLGDDSFGRYDGTNLYFDADFGGSCIYDFAEYNNKLYAAAYCGRLYGSTNGINWSLVLDCYGPHLWELEPFQGKLYLGYDNGELAYIDSAEIRHSVLTVSDSIISIVADGDSMLYFGTGAETEYGGNGSGPGYIYAYTGNGATNATLISGPLGHGVQCLYYPPDPLLITPATGFTACGGVGGPFTVTNETFSLINIGTNLLWSLANTSTWLNASPTNGTLTVGGTTNVTVSLNSNAYFLTSGIYPATIWFTNLSDSVVQSRQFTLTVIGPPIITCPSNITVTATNQCETVVNYTVPVSGGCPPITTNCVPPSGSVFSNGITTVNCSATDSCGRSNSCSFTVTVLPPPPPVISCPGNITVTGCLSGVVVNYTVTVSNGCPPITTNCVPPSGSVFPIGTNTVNCSATDSCGRSNSCSFTVTVLPPPPLIITCPGNITVLTTNPSGAVVNYTVTVSGGRPPITTNCVPSSGHSFPIGTTTVNCNATDSCGQSASCSFTIVVDLLITPATGFTATGCVGGPFTTNSESFLLTNVETASLNWSLANTSSWLNASPGSGTLTNGGSTNVTVSLSSNAYSLTSGVYTATVSFTNLNDGVVQSRQFILTVGLPILSPPQSLTVFPGSPAWFGVSVSGTPPLSFQWQKNGTNLTNGTNISGSTTATLVLNPTTTNDAGNYTVIITNACGSVVTSSPPATLTFSTNIPPLTNLLANPGFELPDIGEYTNFDAGPTPYWNDDGETYVNTGVENIGAHRGYYRAFEMAGDDGAYQISTNTVPLHLGDQVILTWWAVGTTSSDAQGTNLNDPKQIVGIITSTNSQGTPPYVNDPFPDTTAVLISSNGLPNAWGQYLLVYTVTPADTNKYPGVFFNTGEVGPNTPNCFAAYDDFALYVQPAKVYYSWDGSTLTLYWPQGTLLQATNLRGLWLTNGATEPFKVQPRTNGPVMFYRVQVQ